ncbi:MAG TPA: hypothetical protein VII06_02200 [Chloroflexota bacterium]
MLGYLGFDPLAWQEGHYDATHPGYRRLVLLPDDTSQAEASQRGPLAEALAQHTRQFGRPPDRRPKPRVVASAGAPRDGRASAVGSDWLERLGRWLHGG